MGRRSRLELLLIALLLVAPAFAAARDAAPSAQEVAYREVNALVDAGKGREAVAKIDAALQRFSDERNPWIWGLRVQRARVFLATNDADAAFPLLVPEPPAAAAKSDAAVKRLISLAWAYEVRHQAAEARAAIQQAAQLAASAQPNLRADVARTRANVEWRERDLDAAVKYARQSARLARATNNRPAEVKALTTIALILGTQERFDEAIAYNAQALPIARRLGLDSSVLKIRLNLAWTYLQIGQYDSAADSAAEAYRLAVDLGAKNDVFTTLLLQGNVHFQRLELGDASAFYRQAYDFALRTGNPEVGQAAANLAAVALASHDFAAARRYNDEALIWKRKAQDAEAELHSLLLGGRIALGMKQLAEAEPPLKRVIAETKSKALRWEAQTRLAQVYAATGRNALADAEFQRALDAAAEARADVSHEELRMTFADTLLDFYNAYIEFLVANGRPLDALRVTEQSRASTLAEGLGFDLDRASSIDPQQLARSRGAVILTYWLAPERSFLWAITGDGVRVFPLPPAATINGDVDAYSRELLGPRSAIGERGAKLWRMLVGPAAALLPARDARLVVIPDGRLHSLNFETLVAGGTRPHYWIEDVTIETAASLQLAAGASRERSGDRMLLIGDPRVPASKEFPPLAHAAAEMERVRKHFAATKQLAGSAATPSAYEANAGGNYAFVHFVAHGIANLIRPLDSAVILSPDADGYKLYARDIVKHPLSARLVTISSCHGAGTRTYAGEGLVGLAWAFLRAGAHQVIAALWQVSDRATPQLMDRMYDGIRNGRDPASALRDAKLQLMRSSPIYKRPLYWAPFVLYSGS
jgi:CHAT domain-containing protein/tetratricopeptide (TPR) repeat protein